MKPTSLLPAVLAVGLLLTVAPAASAAAPDVDARPTVLPRGADVSGPYVDGTTLVDGTTRIPVAADGVELLGTSGPSYVVLTWQQGSERRRVLHLESDGSSRVVLDRDAAETIRLSSDGARLLTSHTRLGGGTVVRVFDVAGALEARRVFRGYASALDAAGRRVLVTGSAPERTLWWGSRTGRIRVISARRSYRVDLAADRLASFTRDPYDGGCTVVTTLTTPRRQLWRSCTERVEAFSPNGRRMATVHILSDGLGPGAVTARMVHGRKLATYTAHVFGRAWWESRTALLLESFTRTRVAVVRCVGTACERATRIRTHDLGM